MFEGGVRIADWVAAKSKGSVFIEQSFENAECTLTVKKLKDALAYELLVEIKPR